MANINEVYLSDQYIFPRPQLARYIWRILSRLFILETYFLSFQNMTSEAEVTEKWTRVIIMSGFPRHSLFWRLLVQVGFHESGFVWVSPTCSYELKNITFHRLKWPNDNTKYCFLQLTRWCLWQYISDKPKCCFLWLNLQYSVFAIANTSHSVLPHDT